MARVRTTDTEFVLREGETLLEGLERTGHAVEYQCRSGYCGSCRLRLVSGEVVYSEMPMAFVAVDEVLPCCCHAATSEVEVVCGLIQAHIRPFPE
ncbi:class I ribonucleotide reductase maintenance protein YfaE [Conchiformibius steedae]|uniref:2Fe-2S ferredoxin-like protein n=1 Tax=Conchiformibius steedae TaxID=153493 RepID=A0A3P2A8J1_9NEIS|nr:class I ribonucleotide reductase maintenance protein YfaE [Conchiformibius steedae]RRD91747.1 2Fe-2S ferredoxin-like protein [Conchiformibius steedae]